MRKPAGPGSYILDFGANPYDIQVVYDLGFNAEYLWWLPMIHAHAVKTGRGDDWRDPEWTMLNPDSVGEHEQDAVCANREQP